ncbi:hypothetical protein CLOM621_07208 [Clostridium sp. M62/1]|nr:hypothetical protein CLOM621_07208 [Clostridium sp. M62/1]
MERVYKHYYYIIRGKCRFCGPPQAKNPAEQDSLLFLLLEINRAEV